MTIVRRRSGRWAFAAAALVLGVAVGVQRARALDPAKAISQFNAQTWTRQHGLPANAISAIAQTNDGYIWLGTGQGLVRFDGLRFEMFAADFPGARGREVRQIVPARSGGLWLTINHGGYAHFDGETFTTIPDERWTNPATTGKTILEARDGTLWTGSNRGVGRWIRDRSGESFTDETAARVFALAEDGDGRMWLGTEERGLFIHADGKVVPFGDPALKREIIFAIAADPEGGAWVATQRGLHRFDAQGGRIPIPPIDSEVKALLVDRHGVLWIGTSSMGLARWENGEYGFFRQADGLGGDAVTALCEDAEGSLWVGTREGLTQLSDVKFPFVTQREGIVGGVAHTVSASRQGGVWISTSTGLSHFDGKAARNFKWPMLENAFVKLAFEASNGDVYFVDGDKTLSVLSGDRIVRRIRSAAWVEAMAEDARGVLVAHGSQLARVVGEEIVPFEFEGAPPAFGYIDNIVVTREGAIWLGTQHGIFRISGGISRSWTAADGLPGERVYSIAEDAEGIIWAGTPGGLARIKGGLVTAIRAEHGLADDAVFSIVADEHGYFWIDSPAGIYRVKRETLNAFADGRAGRVACELFDGQDSVKSFERIDQEFSGARSADGRIWFPNSRGVTQIDPVNFFRNTVPPPVIIEEMRAGEAVRRNPKNVRLDVGNNRVEFRFATLSYVAPRKVRLRYQLEGVDPGWVEAGERRTATYQVNPGRYVFRVEAANGSGVWSTAPATCELEVPPAFYQTWWFALACVAVAALALGRVYHWQLERWRRRQKNLQEANNLLEVKVAERTNELGQSLVLLRTTFDSTADGIFAMRFDGAPCVWNDRFLAMWDVPQRMLREATTEELAAWAAQLTKDPEGALARARELLANPEEEGVDVIELKDGRVYERTCKPQKVEGRTIGIVFNFHDITKRRKVEAEMEEMNRRLRESFRQAGMAEVATSVLHNVGNVLNSVNVSATLVADRVRGSKAAHVAKLRDLVRAHREDLAEFLTSDPRGRQLPDFLDTLAEHLATEQKEVTAEVESLRRNVEHINDIVAMQQSYATVAGATETVVATELVEDAVRMNSSAFAAGEVVLERDFRAEPMVTTERHKVLQILVNLLRNAKFACEESGHAERRVVVRITTERKRVKIAVIDNGVGIAPENLTRIFAHGFTTRKNGHGFGLHSGALAARELGGSLTVRSDGAGRGAEFTLEIPAEPGGADAS